MQLCLFLICLSSRSTVLGSVQRPLWCIKCSAGKRLRASAFSADSSPSIWASFYLKHKCLSACFYNAAWRVLLQLHQCIPPPGSSWTTLDNETQERYGLNGSIMRHPPPPLLQLMRTALCRRPWTLHQQINSFSNNTCYKWSIILLWSLFILLYYFLFLIGPFCFLCIIVATHH